MPNTDEIAELQERVARLETQVAYLARSLGIDVPRPTGGGASPEVMSLVQQGKVLEAIKQYRQETGASLKDAKDFIDSLMGR